MKIITYIYLRIYVFTLLDFAIFFSLRHDLLLATLQILTYDDEPILWLFFILLLNNLGLF